MNTVTHLKRGHFEAEVASDGVRVWIGPANHPEGELVLALHLDYIPDMIAILRAVQDTKRSHR